MAEAHRDEIAKLEALYASNPGGRVFTHLAEAYRKAGEADRAREILAEGMKKHPDSASAFVVLGRVLTDRGDVEEGFDAFHRALELDTGNLVALRWCGDLAMRIGRVDDALGFYRELMARDPSDDNLRERVEVIEADRGAAMSGSVTPTAPQPNAVPEARAYDAPTLEPPVHETPASEPDYGDITGDFSISHDDYDPSGLPGDLAAFAGQQIEERTGKEWTPQENAEEAARQAEDDALFSLDSEDGLFDLPMETEFGMDASVDAGDAAFEGLEPDAGIDLDGALDFSGTMDLEDTAPVRADEEPADLDGFVLSSADTAEADVEIGGFGDAIGGEPTEIAGSMPDVTGDGGATPSQQDTSVDEGFDAVPAGAIATPVTETMAELYRNQGFPDRAADVYRQLIRERGGDARLEEKLAEIEGAMAPAAAPDTAESHVSTEDELVFEQDSSGEMWLRDAESPWTAEEPGGADHTSPYAMPAEPDDQAADAPPIASYLKSLLQWRPTGAEPEEILVLDNAVADEAAVENATDLPWLSEPAPSSLALQAERESGAPAGEEMAAPAAGAAPAEAMPWESTPSAPAAPSMEERMPWEAAPVVEPPAAAAASNEEAMPWETAPAAELPAPEASVASSGTGSEGEVEDDEDLEVFRSWLQSLKK
jgi:tetratricopeptide (TPR) repeat protein